ncbi:phosphohistidine phosphatase SixA [soil metagenome]
MELYVVRHAVLHKRDADLWPDDSKRPLTAEGEERFRHAARGILRLVPEVDLVLSSPFARAWRTAELLERQGWPAPVPCEELEPDYPPHKVVGVLADHAGVGSVALVGHRPGLHELVSYLLTGDAEGASVQIKKGGIVRLQLEGYPEPGSASLRWLVTPKVLRAVCSEPPRDPEG